MASLDSMITFNETLLNLLPESAELKWNRILLSEKRACANYKKNGFEKSVVLFWSTIQNKTQILKVATWKADVLAGKWVSLADTYLLLAQLIFHRKCLEYEPLKVRNFINLCVQGREEFNRYNDLQTIKNVCQKGFECFSALSQKFMN